MFGLGFTEILLIAIVALLFIGPDKLPDTMRSIARTLGKLKRAFDDTKSTIENELRIDDLRQEALSYRREIEKAKEDLSAFKNVANKEVNEIKKAASLDSFKPSNLNDESDLFDDFDDADRDFKELEEMNKKNKPKKIEATYATASTQKEEPKKEQEKSETIDFKHLKSS